MKRLNLNLCSVSEIKHFEEFCRAVGIELPDDYEEIMEGSIVDTGSYEEEYIDATIVFDEFGKVRIDPERDGDDNFVTIFSFEVFSYLYNELNNLENLYTTIVKSKGYGCKVPRVKQVNNN